MTQVAIPPGVPADAERVYLVAADNVAKFYELLDAVRTAPVEEIGQRAKAELLDLWSVVNHVTQSFESSKIVRAKFR